MVKSENVTFWWVFALVQGEVAVTFMWWAAAGEVDAIWQVAVSSDHGARVTTSSALVENTTGVSPVLRLS